MTTTQSDDVVVVALAGEIDMAAEELVHAALSDAVRSGRQVVVDVERVTFMDSTGLRLIVAATMAARDRGGRLGVRNVSGQVADLFSLTGVDTAVDLI